MRPSKEKLIPFFQNAILDVPREDKRVFREDVMYGEDFYFVKKAKEANIRVWMCPWVSVHKVGDHVYMGNLKESFDLHTNYHMKNLEKANAEKKRLEAEAEILFNESMKNNNEN